MRGGVGAKPEREMCGEKSRLLDSGTDASCHVALLCSPSKTCCYCATCSLSLSERAELGIILAPFRFNLTLCRSVKEERERRESARFLSIGN